MPTRKKLEALFRKSGIDFTRPGFCDSPEFQVIERHEPGFLNLYAQFIQKSTFPAEYLNRARVVIRDTAEFLYHELVVDGRMGACVDISGAMLRFLERQGIWCHVVCGGLKIEFPAASGLGPRWFCPLMHENNKAFTGHAWIYAPPFKVVDLSVSLQPYPPEQQRYFDRHILAEQCDQPRQPITASELMDNELVEDFVSSRRRMPSMSDLDAHLRQFMKEFPACEFSGGELRFTYIPVKISGPDLPLEQTLYPILSGRSPMQVFEEFNRSVE